ncbi:GNAT family N-acetyltransferase [Streptomyces sp. NPDC093675]|uniref:GNAT family N-acetyltransferase n=1 Tax=Streptomyces sp. NPDC093675 TaxID=3366049 RepID=UPI0037F27B78
MTSGTQDSTGGGRVEAVNDPNGRFYELRYDGEAVGMLVYETVGSRVVLTHTAIREGFRGRGLSRALIRYALDDLDAQGARITVRCPVVDRFIDDNPQYRRLIAPGEGGDRAR